MIKRLLSTVNIFMVGAVLSIAPASVHAMKMSDNLSSEFFVGYKHDPIDSELNSVGNDTTTGLFYGVNATYTFKNSLMLNTILFDSTKSHGKIDDIIKSFALTYSSQIGENPYTISVGRVIIPFGINEIQRIIPSPIIQKTLNDSIWNSVVGSRVIAPSNNGIYLAHERGLWSFHGAYYAPTGSSDDAFKENVQYQYGEIFEQVFAVESPTGNGEQRTLFDVIRGTQTYRNIFTGAESDANNQAGSSGDERASTRFIRSLDCRSGSGTCIIRMFEGEDVEVLTLDVSNIQTSKVFLGTTYDNRTNTQVDLEYVFSSTDFKVGTFTENYLYLGGRRQLKPGIYATGEASAYLSKSVDGKSYSDSILAAGITKDDYKYVYHLFMAKSFGDLVNVSEISADVTYVIDYYKHVRVGIRRVSGDYSDVAKRLCDSCIPSEATESITSNHISSTSLTARFAYYF